MYLFECKCMFLFIYNYFCVVSKVFILWYKMD